MVFLRLDDHLAQALHNMSIKLAACPPSLVVVAALRDEDSILGGLVDQSVLVIDAARPVALESVLERLRLADAFVAVSDDVCDEGADPLQGDRDRTLRSRRRDWTLASAATGRIRRVAADCRSASARSVPDPTEAQSGH